MEELILFGLSFIFMFVVYEIIIKSLNKYKAKYKLDFELIEVGYLEKKYKLDLKKVNYKRLLHVIAFTSSLDIALIVTIIVNIKNYVLEIVLGFIVTLVIILLSYHIVYLVYKKKGMIKNDTKRNRK